MNAIHKRKAAKLFFAIVFIYTVGGIALYFFQDKILFHPKPLSREYRFSFEQTFEEINIPFEKDNLNILRFKTSSNPKGVVLFYHGNMENVEHYKNYPSFFLRNNYEVWMIDYPGFGKTTGSRTEKIMNAQALLMYDLAVKEINNNIIIYGKSMGTGVASYVAANRNCMQLILETPYYSISALAKHYFPIYPVNSLIKYSFPVHNYLKKVQALITVFHGTKDEVVPYKHSRWLKEENKNIELITLENGKHNNLSDFNRFQKKMDSLLIK
jgi:uncharacterized protein